MLGSTTQREISGPKSWLVARTHMQNAFEVYKMNTKNTENFGLRWTSGKTRGFVIISKSEASYLQRCYGVYTKEGKHPDSVEAPAKYALQQSNQILPQVLTTWWNWLLDSGSRGQDFWRGWKRSMVRILSCFMVDLCAIMRMSKRWCYWLKINNSMQRSPEREVIVTNMIANIVQKYRWTGEQEPVSNWRVAHTLLF